MGIRKRGRQTQTPGENQKRHGVVSSTNQFQIKTKRFRFSGQEIPNISKQKQGVFFRIDAD
jgi:hypothetical protein